MMVMIAVMVVELEVVIAVAILTKMANLTKDRRRVDGNLNETSELPLAYLWRRRDDVDDSNDGGGSAEVVVAMAEITIIIS